MATAPKTLGDLRLFTGAPQLENFAHFKDLIPVQRMEPSRRPRPWPAGAAVELPGSFPFGGEHRPVAEMLERTGSAALLILRDGEIRYEHYWHTGGPEVQWISMSVAKSFVSALVGMLVDDGTIPDIGAPISDHIAVEPGSAYDGVSIRDVLLMSSGARWNEDYSNPESDVAKFMPAMRPEGEGLDAFVSHMTREFEPGTLCRYNSGDTLALGMLLRAVSGRSIGDLMQEKLMDPLGAEQPGYWAIDAFGVEMAAGGLNLTARDFARLGELYRLGGEWDGARVVSEEWVRDSTRVTAPQCSPERMAEPGEDPHMGYGYQWWLPTNDHGAFSAIGVYNQFIFVDPTTKTTIVKLSANPAYGTTTDPAVNATDENIALLLHLAAQDF
ncbi:serine hydrolase domain-containing protein [Microbacterium sp. zg.Y909]|uniref:serine hydrolase domain-containing protein n=1 Tax=Microbacterium sp. zg.Y909 TaxID=2969413 RepID=UPI00214C79BB|nr:serine hydrolase [Microbacterium sp. zg.Y909]MCR2825007.1 beta-lactamase family protein [Microbacterium sp. zg.Y909]